MNMKDQLSVLAYFFCILNGLFLIIGFLQMGFGMWILYDKNSFFTALVYADPQNNIMMDIAYTLLCTGVFIIVPFAVGYLGIIKESRCLLILYIVIIAQMAILQFSMIILILLQKNNGCKNAFTIWFFVNMNVLVSIEFGLLILEIALLLITVFLLKIVKKKTTVFIAT
uniref:Tetraspanin-19 n=1 Tax=Geotrypetes seraphini TaxID=260995 RepID=A0A6P8RQK9_GEOSA|nr:putative tetraspanin-19 [Geotrypetes seraphini]